MAGVELIVAALTAGAAAGAGLGAKEAISGMIADSYRGLKSLIKSRLTDQTEAIAAIEADYTEVETLRPAVESALVDSGSSTDQEVLSKARELLEMLEEPAVKYMIDNRGAKGVMIGDHSSQTNHFS